MDAADPADVDEAALRAAAAAAGVDPDGPLCPNCHRLANGDGTLPEKAERLADGITERMERRRRDGGGY